ncbi:GNAT family N-acetyltransferase [Vibrio harveyi]|uniref:GNAT family N-acetyltransferase n=1 Tax=Vibrio harveyi TaxID=669 RepID=UPI002ED14D84|nr:GNAT family N-acetyltransferase [Vibrio harveyi]
MLVRKVEFDELHEVLDLVAVFDVNNNETPRAAYSVVSDVYSRLVASGGFILGAYSDGRLVGTATFNLCQNFSWSCLPFAVIENLVVDENYRNNGVGKLLLQHIDKECEANRCYKVIGMTSHRNSRAIKLYLSLGFTLDKFGIEKRYRKNDNSLVY